MLSRGLTAKVPEPFALLVGDVIAANVLGVLSTSLQKVARRAVDAPEVAISVNAAFLATVPAATAVNNGGVIGAIDGDL